MRVSTELTLTLIIDVILEKTFDDNRNWRLFILLFRLVLPSPALLVIIATSIVLILIVWVIVSFLIVRWCLKVLLIVVAWPIRLSETRQPARAADENEEEDSLEQQQLHLLPQGHFWRSVTPAFLLLPFPDFQVHPLDQQLVARVVCLDWEETHCAAAGRGWETYMGALWHWPVSAPQQK